MNYFNIFSSFITNKISLGFMGGFGREYERGEGLMQIRLFVFIKPLNLSASLSLTFFLGLREKLVIDLIQITTGKLEQI